MAETLYELLEKDHVNVKYLLGKVIDKESAKEFPQIKKELKVHMGGEEQYFYPELKKTDEIIIIEGHYEHDVARRIIEDIEGEKEESNQWLGRVKVLKDLIEHHIKEEEDEIFSLARKNLGKKKEEEIHRKFAEEKRKNNL